MVSRSCHNPGGLGFSRTGCNKARCADGTRQPAGRGCPRAASFGRTQGVFLLRFQRLCAQVWIRTLPCREAAPSLYGDKQLRPEAGTSVSTERGPMAQRRRRRGPSSHVLTGKSEAGCDRDTETSTTQPPQGLISPRTMQKKDRPSLRFISQQMPGAEPSALSTGISSTHRTPGSGKSQIVCIYILDEHATQGLFRGKT